MSRTTMAARPHQAAWAWRGLIGLAAVQAVLYAVIAWLSREFVFGAGHQQRPIVPVVVLLTICFGLSAASLASALRVGSRARLAGLVVLSAVVFRGILLFSVPIQEIDIYRYLWDGAVTSQGVSPFRYAPAQVLAAAPSELDREQSPPELQRLVRIADESPALAEILRRVHYPELTTVYPPVSQAVFALAARLTPRAASLSARMTILKAVLLAFDLATIGLVWLLVSAAGKHPAWTIAYAWCPLVMKEFANSGHLDAIAVCLTTAAVWCLANSLRKERPDSLRWPSAAGVLLGLAVGAKLYPIVLFPFMTAVSARTRGLWHGGALALAALVVTGASLFPMFLTESAASVPAAAATAESPPLPSDDLANSPAPPESAASPGPSSGLSAFLSRWEMNDLLFMIVVENLRPQEAKPDQPAAWFDVIPEGWKGALIVPVADVFSADAERAAFLLARAVTTIAFLGIAVWLVWRAAQNNSPPAFLEAAFLTLAWFWLLSPTQNSWYWTWALPLLPFARGRAWFAVSGLVVVYYLRFWLLYHWPDETILGTEYKGALFFDFVVTWIEFGPWFLWLAGAALLRSRRADSETSTTNNSECVSGFTEPQALRA